MNRRIEVSRFKSMNRRLFVVDIENAVGCGCITEADVTSVYTWVCQSYRPTDNDLVVLGVSHGNNAFSAVKWPGARVVKRDGHDGADLALKQVLTKEGVERRFTDVVLVSGDGGFVEEVAYLRSRGLRVEVAAPAASLSGRLARTVSVIRLMTRNRKKTMRLAA